MRFVLSTSRHFCSIRSLIQDRWETLIWSNHHKIWWAFRSIKTVNKSRNLRVPESPLLRPYVDIDQAHCECVEWKCVNASNLFRTHDETCVRACVRVCTTKTNAPLCEDLLQSCLRLPHVSGSHSTRQEFLEFLTLRSFTTGNLPEVVAGDENSLK